MHGRVAFVLVAVAGCANPRAGSARAADEEERAHASAMELAPACGAAKDVHAAARCFDLEAVRRHVERDPGQVRAKDERGLSPLVTVLTHKAVYWGRANDPRQLAVARYLLSKGADPRVRFAYQGTADATLLHVAALEGQVPVLTMLLDAGAEIDARDERGRTPLHWAAICDFRISCDDCPAQPNIRHDVRWGATPAIEYLLRRGADGRAVDLDGRSPLDLVPKPCGGEAHPSCDAETLEHVEWYSGTCRHAYETLRRAVAAPGR